MAGEPLGHIDQHFPLTGAQRFERAGSRAVTRQTAGFLKWHGTELIAGGNGPDGLDQFHISCCFDDVAPGTGSEGHLRIGSVVVHGENHDAEAGQPGQQPADQLRRSLLGHAQVKRQHVDAGVEPSKHIIDTARLTADSHTRFVADQQL